MTLIWRWCDRETKAGYKCSELCLGFSVDTVHQMVPYVVEILYTLRLRHSPASHTTSHTQSHLKLNAQSSSYGWTQAYDCLSGSTVWHGGLWCNYYGIKLAIKTVAGLTQPFHCHVTSHTHVALSQSCIRSGQSKAECTGAALCHL